MQFYTDLRHCEERSLRRSKPSFDFDFAVAVVPRFMRGIQRGCFVVRAFNHAGFRGQAAERRVSMPQNEEFLKHHKATAQSKLGLLRRKLRSSQ